MLRCPKCKKTLRSPRLASDPPKTYEVRMTCHECQNGGYDDTSYHDKNGKEIAQHNVALCHPAERDAKRKPKGVMAVRSGDLLAMIKRPLNSRFSDAFREGIKITTIRDKAWPVGKSVMLYNWSGAAYRSKQMDVAAVTVLASSPVTITRIGDAMTYQIAYEWPIGPLWKTEGFKSQEEMDSWFRPKMKSGQAIQKALMRFMANDRS